MGEAKYKAQQKYNRKNYVRFPLDLKPEVLEAFRAACTAKGTTPTTEIKKFIAQYCAQSEAAQDESPVNVEVEIPARLDAAAERDGLDLSLVLQEELKRCLDL